MSDQKRADWTIPFVVSALILLMIIVIQLDRVVIALNKIAEACR